LDEQQGVEPVVRDFHATLGRDARRRPERLAIVVGTLLLVAVIKPWPAALPAATGPPRHLATPVPTERVFASDLPCSASQWLLEADERWGGAPARTWTFTEAVEASGPLDPAISFATIAAQQLLAIGYCPAFWDDQRPHQRLTIYQLDGGGAIVIPTAPVLISRGDDASDNTLFRPAGGPAGSSPDPEMYGRIAWQEGRYVMQIASVGGYQRWLGFDVRIVSASGFETAPAPSPAMPPTPGWDDTLPTSSP
jgi:hypothetical protein